MNPTQSRRKRVVQAVLELLLPVLGELEEGDSESDKVELELEESRRGYVYAERKRPRRDREIRSYSSRAPRKNSNKLTPRVSSCESSKQHINRSSSFFVERAFLSRYGKLVTGHTSGRLCPDGVEQVATGRLLPAIAATGGELHAPTMPPVDGGSV